MFWRKKIKCPITEEDRIWIDNEIQFLKNNFGVEHFMSIKTIEPTTQYFERNFSGTKEDAFYILDKLLILMAFKDVNIELKFYNDSPIYLDDGTILSSPANIRGEWESSAGAFEQTKTETIIYIEESQLKDTTSLIATISHELSHYILLGENRIKENDEFLTDIVAITYGFGIFIANSNFSFYNSADGWQTRSQGYLPEQIIAYLMAKLSVIRNEKTDYNKHLKKSILKYFNQSLKYLDAY